MRELDNLLKVAEELKLKIISDRAQMKSKGWESRDRTRDYSSAQMFDMMLIDEAANFDYAAIDMQEVFTKHCNYHDSNETLANIADYLNDIMLIPHLQTKNRNGLQNREK